MTSHSQFTPVPPQNPSSLDDKSDTDSDAAEFHDARFPPEEETSLLAESNDHKTHANTLFTSSRYDEAISIYDQALASCPNYLDYEIAVLQSNIAACHLKLSEWKEAIEAATRSLDRLEALDPLPKPKRRRPSKSGADKDRGTEHESTATANGRTTTTTSSSSAAEVIELSSSEDEATFLHNLNVSDTRRAEISRIRAKALLRRARARLESGGWSNLSGAEEDYKLLSTLPNLHLPPSDLRTVRAALREIPPKLDAAKEKETAEMFGKLKELGNGILKPFGLSTENFKMVKDEKTGGYSMNFQK